MGDHYKFHLHQKVREIDGGTSCIIVSIFRTLGGDIRYVVQAINEFDNDIFAVVTEDELEPKGDM
jgi:hypothetical protein